MSLRGKIFHCYIDLEVDPVEGFIKKIEFYCKE